MLIYKNPTIPLVAASLLLFIFLLCSLTASPLIDNHPEWQSVWNPKHIEFAAAQWQAFFINSGIVITLLVWGWIIHLYVKKTDAVSLATALFLGVIVFHLGCKWLPFAANGLFNAKYQIFSGFYDPKALPPYHIFKFIWTLLLIVHFFAMLACLIYFIYLAICRQFNYKFLFICHLLITDSLLGLPLPDFWVWFMD